MGRICSAFLDECTEAANALARGVPEDDDEEEEEQGEDDEEGGEGDDEGEGYSE
jgi:hypothetical protein